jgi:Subtilase family
LECVTPACQPARYSSHRDVHDIGSLLVRESLDQYQAHDLALLLRQPGQRALDRNDIRLPVTARIRNTLAKLLRRKNPLAPVPRADLVDPRIAQNAEHPARHRRIRPQLIRTRQSTLDRNVHEVIGVLHASGQRPRESPQPRQQADNLLPKVFAQCRHAISGSLLKGWILKIGCPLLIITVQTAHAQVSLPNVRLPALPQPQLPDLTRTLSGTVEQVDPGALKDVRKLRLRDLLRRNRATLEADRNGAPIVRGEVLAVSPSDAQLNAALAAGFTIVRVRTLDGLDTRIVVLGMPKGLDTQHGLLRLRELVPDASLDFNHIYTDSGGAVSPAGEPAPQSNGATESPATAQKLPGKLGLIDSGVDVTHPVFKDVPIHPYGCAGSPVPGPHGTAVASLMIGRSAEFHGAAPGSELYAADVFCGSPTGGAADAVSDAFAWLAREKAAVINVSLVGPPNVVLEAVVRLVVARGHLIVAAVGNDGPAAPPLYPASYPGVIGVTGVDTRHRVLIEACRGPQVKFAAPGADMSAAKSSQTFDLVRGTSYAAPIVASLLAGMLQEPDKEAAARAVDDLARSALDLGPAGMDPTYGYGLVGADLAPHHHP